MDFRVFTCIFIRFSLLFSEGEEGGETEKNHVTSLSKLNIFRSVSIFRTPRDLTEARIEDGTRTSYTRTHASWRWKGTRGRGGSGSYRAFALLRSSNEESSRVLARRSARSVSTRLAIEQHRDGRERLVPNDDRLFVFFLPRNLVCFFCALRPERYFGRIDID